MSEIGEDTWAREETCRPLASDEKVREAEQFVQAYGLPLHHDKWKNWDSWLAIYHARRLVEPWEAVLDAGACRDPNSPSVFLPSLQKFGFADLTGCNLDETEDTEVENGIRYEYCDIERMRYAGGHFGFVACLSTIEHGVDWRRYFAESGRVLRPGGYLFTSFDYWETPVDTKGQMAFGAPIRIFTAHDVMQMAMYAKTCGLDLMKRPVLTCGESPVEWMGMKYTFMNLLMRKSRAAGEG